MVDGRCHGTGDLHVVCRLQWSAFERHGQPAGTGGTTGDSHRQFENTSRLLFVCWIRSGQFVPVLETGPAIEIGNAGDGSMRRVTLSLITVLLPLAVYGQRPFQENYA